MVELREEVFLPLVAILHPWLPAAHRELSQLTPSLWLILAETPKNKGGEVPYSPKVIRDKERSKV